MTFSTHGPDYLGIREKGLPSCCTWKRSASLHSWSDKASYTHYLIILLINNAYYFLPMWYLQTSWAVEFSIASRFLSAFGCVDPRDTCTGCV